MPNNAERCINQYKNTNLKANHNADEQTKKLVKLYQPIQKYKFESKSQLKSAPCRTGSSCINQYKNTNLKANHNSAVPMPVPRQAVSTNTKIQI